MQDAVTKHVILEGIRPIMFDKYGGDNKIVLPPEQKMYFADDGETIVVPCANIYSFLGATNTRSVARAMCGKKWATVAAAATGFINIDPDPVPLKRAGKPIKFGTFRDGKDAKSMAYVKQDVARLPKGIPNPKVRPVLPLPWGLEFDITLFKNPDVDMLLIRQMFEFGGLALGLGTYRGVFGKFVIKEWK